MTQLCAACLEPHARQPLGHWTRSCSCDTRRYWCPLRPTPADLIAFLQLTGSAPPHRNGDTRY